MIFTDVGGGVVVVAGGGTIGGVVDAKGSFKLTLALAFTEEGILLLWAPLLLGTVEGLLGATGGGGGAEIDVLIVED